MSQAIASGHELTLLLDGTGVLTWLGVARIGCLYNLIIHLGIHLVTRGRQLINKVKILSKTLQVDSWTAAVALCSIGSSCCPDPVRRSCPLTTRARLGPAVDVKNVSKKQWLDDWNGLGFLKSRFHMTSAF